jgi:AmiR/NasT family two-component response regulator
LTSARLVDGLEVAVGSRHLIGMAQGVVMERYGLSADQAFSLLQRLSSTTNTKLRDIAGQIVATREVPIDRLAPERSSKDLLDP